MSFIPNSQSSRMFCSFTYLLIRVNHVKGKGSEKHARFGRRL